jgi:hypothetical protein
MELLGSSDLDLVVSFVVLVVEHLMEREDVLDHSLGCSSQGLWHLVDGFGCLESLDDLVVQLGSLGDLAAHLEPLVGYQLVT